MSNILSVGIATIDIINEVESYPKEDSEVRTIAQNCQRGGNATNTLVVLSQLKHHCFWAGTLANDRNKHIISQDLDKYHINYTNVVEIEDAINPTSYIIHSHDTATRSIIHHRNLAEYSFENFKHLLIKNDRLKHLDWIHFEGRNIENVYLMQQYCKENFPHIKISVEIEKSRPQIERLYEYADVILFSKPFAIKMGYSRAEDFFLAQSKNTKNKILSCTWGDKGASLWLNNKLFNQVAYQTDKLVDTLAAGDTFNAALIHALLKTNIKDLSDTSGTQILAFASRVAGEKCAHKGINISISSQDYLSKFKK